jgi:2-methylcitrate dehydratase PrpD
MAVAVDSFIHIMDENNLDPEVLKKVKVTEWKYGTTASFAFCRDNQLETQEDIYFNIAYLIACAAYKYHPSRWLDSSIFEDRKIREFMKKVEKNEEADTSLLGVEIVTKDGKTFSAGDSCTGGVCQIKSKEKVIRGGVQFPEEETREKLLDKFINNASRKLSLSKSNNIVQMVLNLEELKNVDKLMHSLSPLAEE